VYIRVEELNAINKLTPLKARHSVKHDF